MLKMWANTLEALTGFVWLKCRDWERRYTYSTSTFDLFWLFFFYSWQYPPAFGRSLSSSQGLRAVTCFESMILFLTSCYAILYSMLLKIIFDLDHRKNRQNTPQSTWCSNIVTCWPVDSVVVTLTLSVSKSSAERVGSKKSSPIYYKKMSASKKIGFQKTGI